MPYVKRNLEGKIEAVFDHESDANLEFVEANTPELNAFIAGLCGSAQSTSADTYQELKKSDRDIARVTEDVISLLIDKNLIIFTELPDAVQSKLLEREKLRSQLYQSQASFLDDSEYI